MGNDLTKPYLSVYFNIDTPDQEEVRNHFLMRVIEEIGRNSKDQLGTGSPLKKGYMVIINHLNNINISITQLKRLTKSETLHGKHKLYISIDVVKIIDAIIELSQGNFAVNVICKEYVERAKIEDPDCFYLLLDEYWIAIKKAKRGRDSDKELTGTSKQNGSLKGNQIFDIYDQVMNSTQRSQKCMLVY